MPGLVRVLSSLRACFASCTSCVGFTALGYISGFDTICFDASPLEPDLLARM
jgi:hypothetical protein